MNAVKGAKLWIALIRGIMAGYKDSNLPGYLFSCIVADNCTQCMAGEEDGWICRTNGKVCQHENCYILRQNPDFKYLSLPAVGPSEDLNERIRELIRNELKLDLQITDRYLGGDVMAYEVEVSALLGKEKIASSSENFYVESGPPIGAIRIERRNYEPGQY